LAKILNIGIIFRPKVAKLFPHWRFLEFLTCCSEIEFIACTIYMIWAQRKWSAAFQ